MKKSLWILGSFLTIGISLALYLWFTYPTASPLVSAEYIIVSWLQPHKALQKQVIGFLPFWQISTSPSIHYDTISELNYFSLSLDSDYQVSLFGH